MLPNVHNLVLDLIKYSLHHNINILNYIVYIEVKTQ